MGVMCQIHLHTPPDGVYRPGGVVAGFLKYAVDQNTTFNDIVVSLRGKGRCKWIQKNGKNRTSHVGTETYANIYTSILTNKDEGKQLVAAGAYSAPFTFTLPNKIPPSYKDSICNIVYYVSIKFTRPGMFNFKKKFQKQIIVISSNEPTLPDGSIIYGLQKQLTDIFSKKESVVKLKATVSRSMVPPSDKVEILYNIENDTNVNIMRVTTNLLEVTKFTSNYGKVKKHHRKLIECKTTIEEIEAKSTQTCGIVVPTLADLSSIQHSKILSRDYYIIVSVKLPMPHRNVSLSIPLVIGRVLLEQPASEELPFDEVPMEDAPPSYWQAMDEHEKEESKEQ